MGDTYITDDINDINNNESDIIGMLRSKGK